MTEVDRQAIEIIRDRLLSSAETLRRTADACAGQVAAAAETIARTFREGGKLLLCGNGGSAADCQHLAAELTSLLTRANPREGLPAISLASDPAFLTARANDFGFEDVFRRAVGALGRRGDTLLCISTSGNSPNVVRGAEEARRRGLHVVALTGGTGGALLDHADLAILVPSSDVQHVQEAHAALGHVLCEHIERRLLEDAP